MNPWDGYSPRHRPDALNAYLTVEQDRRARLAALPKLPGRCVCGKPVVFDFLAGRWLRPVSGLPCSHTADGRG